MNYGAKVNEAKYLCQKGRRTYADAETRERQEEGIRDMEQGINTYKMILSAGAPDYLRKNIQDLITNEEPMLAKMKENLGKIAAKVKPQAQGGGGGGGDDSNEDKDKLAAQIKEVIVTETPNVHWEDVAGLKSAKTSIQEAVIMPMQFPNFFNDVVKPWKGILLYGPPGTGKTLLAKACATEVECKFFSLSSSDIISKFVGESERLIQALFNMARENESSIIFIDEVDSMVSKRSENENEGTKRVKTEFLVQMDGVGSDHGGRVLTLGATNIPWNLDDAMLRRFEKRVYIDLPDFEARRYLLEHV